jgi:hypothetical protein
VLLVKGHRHTGFALRAKKQRALEPEIVTVRRAPPLASQAVQAEALAKLKQRFPQHGTVVEATCTEVQHGHGTRV